MIQIKEMSDTELRFFMQEQAQDERAVTEHMKNRDKLLQMDTDTLRREHGNKKEEQQETDLEKELLSEMPEQNLDQKESKRLKENKTHFARHLARLQQWKKNLREDKGGVEDRTANIRKRGRLDSQAKSMFEETLDASKLTPKEVKNNFAGIRSVLDNWRDHIKLLEQEDLPENLLSREKQLRLVHMREQYELGEEAFRQALRALGYGYRSDGEQAEVVNLKLSEEEKQQALERNRELRAQIAESSANMDDRVTEDLLEEKRQKLHDEEATFRHNVRQDEKYSFIQSERLSHEYQYAELANVKELILAHPQEYAQHKELVDKLTNELYHLMEASGVLFELCMVSAAMCDSESAKVFTKKVFAKLGERMKAYNEEAQLVKERAEAVKSAISHFLKGGEITEIESLSLAGLIPLEEEHRQSRKAATAAAGNYVEVYWEKKAIGDVTEDPVLAKQFVEQYLQNIKGFDTMSLASVKDEELLERAEELQELAVTGQLLSKAEKLTDPEDEKGRSIWETLTGGDRSIELKCRVIQSYALKARALSMIQAYHKGGLTEDCFFKEELDVIHERLGLENAEPLSRPQLLLAARELLEKAMASYATAINTYYNDMSMAEKYGVGSKINVTTAHPQYMKKLRDTDRAGLLSLNSRVNSMQAPQLEEFYQICSNRITELQARIEEGQAAGREEPELVAELEMYRGYLQGTEQLYALTRRKYRKTGETDSQIKEEIFRSFDAAESMPAFREMSEEEFETMCNQLSAGALAQDAAVPERFEHYYAQNMQGLRTYKERIRQHYEMLEEIFHHKMPSMEYVAENEQRLRDWLANTQVDGHIVEKMRDLVDLTNSEDLRLYHLVEFYKAMGFYITGIPHISMDYESMKEQIESPIYTVKESAAYLEEEPVQKERPELEAELEELRGKRESYEKQEEWLRKMEAMESPLMAEKFRQVGEEATGIFQKDEQTLLTYLQRVTELSEYIGRYEGINSLYMQQFHGWMDMVRMRMPMIVERLSHSRQQLTDKKEILNTANSLAEELQAGDAQRFLDAVMEMGKMRLSLQTADAAQAEVARQEGTWQQLEQAELTQGFERLKEMPEPFREQLVQLFYAKQEQLLNRMEQEVAVQAAQLPAQTEEKARKRLAAYLIRNTDLGREYIALNGVRKACFEKEGMSGKAAAYAVSHPEQIARGQQMDRELEEAIREYDNDFRRMGYTRAVGQEYRKSFGQGFVDKEAEAKRHNAHADAESYDILFAVKKAQRLVKKNTFEELAGKLGRLQVTEEMLSRRYMEAHMEELLVSFEAMDAYDALLKRNPALEETLPAEQRIAWRKNKGIYERYRTYVSLFARTRSVDVQAGEYLTTEEYEAQAEEMDRELVAEEGKLQDVLGDFGNYAEKLRGMTGRVNGMKKLKKKDKAAVLEPLQTAEDWMSDLTRYLGQELVVSDESFFDATVMTLMSMLGYLEKSLRQTREVMGAMTKEAGFGDMIAQLQEFSDTFSQFKERIPGYSRDYRELLEESGAEMKITLHEALLGAQGIRAFTIEDWDTNVGAGTSDVYKVEDGGKRYYFKEDEKLEDFYEGIRKELSLLENEELEQGIWKILVKEKDCITQIKENEQKGIPSSDELKSAYRQARADVGDFAWATMEIMNAVQDNKPIPQEYLESLGKQTGADVIAYVAEHRERWLKFCNAYSKKTTTADNAYSPRMQLKEGANMTARNYASERVAELLGLKNLIVRNSEAVIVSKDGKKKKGFVMEEARGKTKWALKEEVSKAGAYPGYEIHVSGEAQKQLLNLQILDNITGQSDRHEANYLLDYVADDENKCLMVTKVTGIDNDFSFGMAETLGGITTQSVLDGDTDKYDVGMMDRELYERMQAVSPELLAAQLEGVIEPEYLEALKKRYVKVRGKIREAAELAEKSGEDFFRIKSGWGEESEKQIAGNNEMLRLFLNRILSKK